MMGGDSDTGSAMNWPFAIFLSIIVHVIGLGAFYLCLGPSSKVNDADVVAESELALSDKNDPKVAEKSDEGHTVSQNENAKDQVSPEPNPAAASTRVPQEPRSNHTTPNSTPSTVRPATQTPSNVVSNNESSHNSPRVATAATNNKTIIYEVKPGDNLTKIAQRHKCTVTEIAKLNKIKPNKVLWVGLKLKIPAPVE